MDDDVDPIIEYDELKRLRDQIKNLKLENDKLRQRTLPTLPDNKPTQRTTTEPVDGVLLADNVDDVVDDVLADLLDIDELSLADEETWLSPSRGGLSGAELAAWLRRDADAPADFARPRVDSEPRRGVDCRTFTRRKTPARPALRCSATARGLDSTFRVLSEPHLNLTQELRLLETSSSQDELNGTYDLSANHAEEFRASSANQREDLYECSAEDGGFHLSPARRAGRRQASPNGRPAFREAEPGSPNRRAASWDSLDERPMDDVRSMARLQQQSLHLAVSTPKPQRILTPTVAVDDGLPSPIASETSSSASSRTGSAGNIATEPRALPSNALPKMKPVSAAAAASRPNARASGLPRPLSRIPAPRARKPAWADGCY